MFLQRGYDNVSLNDVIADARVSKGAFYHWLPSKDALITALAERSAHDGIAAVEDQTLPRPYPPAPGDPDRTPGFTAHAKPDRTGLHAR